MLRVPGAFSISHQAFGDIKMHLNMKGIRLDNSFRINELSFGEKENFNAIASQFPDAGIMHPLDGFERKMSDEKMAMRVGFYLKAVPAMFYGEFASWFLRIFNENRMFHKNEVFQLTASSETEF